MMIDDDRQNYDMRSTPESPGGGRSLHATGEGPILPGSDGTTNGEAHLNPTGRYVSDGFRKTGSRGQRMINIATWNVRTLYECGKLAQVKAEAERLSIDIMGMSETRWTGKGQFQTDGWTFYYSGGANHQRGVGFLVTPKIAKSVMKVEPINERVILMKINSKPKPINIIQVYFPTGELDEDIVLEVYSDLQKVLRKCPKNDRIVVMGDFNAKIGANTRHTACGMFGLGETNELTSGLARR